MYVFVNVVNAFLNCCHQAI